MAQAPTDVLEAAAARHRGSFLEGLEFSNFHEFHTWCVAERAHTLRDRAALLNELVARAADDPERALPHARALVGLFPYEESYRATLKLGITTTTADAEGEVHLGLGLHRPGQGDDLAARAVLHRHHAHRPDFRRRRRRPAIAGRQDQRGQQQRGREAGSRHLGENSTS